MSVTNEEVSGGSPGSITGGSGGGGTTPTPATTTTNGSSGSTGSSGGTSASDDVVKTGYLRKLKGKKKFFVLRKETEAEKPARLEYYANERKFRMGQPPKRSIVLKACFNINRTDSKCKYSIALHTHNDCVRIAMNSEDEMNDWLRVMNSLAGDEEEDETLPTLNNRPHFEHIWLVTALNKGLGSKENILGPYRLCLTSKELTLLKVGDHDGKNAVVKFPLNVIRNVSHDATFGCFFHIEFGRLATTGPGQLSLKTEDNNIAQNMHLLILKAMQNYSKDELIPREREGCRRARTYTWNNDSTSTRSNSFHSTPPGMTRINSMDGSMRLRTESMSSSSERARGTGMSPPVPILSTTPSIAFNSPMCSTGTDSASSSYSMDYDNNVNNNNNNGSGIAQRGSHRGPGSDYSKSHEEEDESYVPWNPGEEQQPSLSSMSSLTLPLHSVDCSDYVETSIISKESGSTAQTPSSYMEMQSPMSPYDNYMPMSPAMMMGGGGSVKSSGKLSVSHSRNSSLIEEHEGYVAMIPGAHHSRSESGACSTAGSTTGLDDAYLDMDFTRKLNLSNDDMRRMSPASSESIQSGTPSSDFPLEKVISYLQPDDLDEGSIAMRPARAYSVGSRSDTSSTGKGRSGKNRLEAVQETFRIRAMSVGSKTPRRPINPSGGLSSAISGAVPAAKATGITPLSSSWSGSTGRWPPLKFPTSSQYQIQTQSHHPTHSYTTSESADSDLMELDFSHNKKSRKRSLPGPSGNLSSGSNSGSSNIKISPIPKGLLGSGNDSPPGAETPEIATKSSFSANFGGNGGNGSPRYATSAPISIQKCNKSLDGGMGYPDTGVSILTRMTGLDLKKLKELDDDGAYLDMDFSSNNKPKAATSSDKTFNTDSMHRKTSIKSSNSSSFLGNIIKNHTNHTNNTHNPVVVRANETVNVIPAKFTLNFIQNTSPVVTTSQSFYEAPPLSRSLSSSSNISTASNNSNSSNTSCVSVKSQQLQHQPSQQPLTSPEANHSFASSCHPLSTINVVPSSLPTTLSVPGVVNTATTATTTTTTTGLSRIEESPEKQDPTKGHHHLLQSPPQSPTVMSSVEQQVTYASIQHLPPVRRNINFSCSGVVGSGASACGTAASSTVKATLLNYAQLEFLQSAEAVKPN